MTRTVQRSVVRLIWALGLVTGTIACTPRESPPANVADARAVAPPAGPASEGDTSTGGQAPSAKKPPGPPADSVDELPELEGRSPDEVVARLGPFDSSKDFEMGDCCHEFEIELYNTYPPGKGHDGVEIRRLDWEFEGYRVSVWFHRPDGDWVALDTCRYADGVDF